MRVVEDRGDRGTSACPADGPAAPIGKLSLAPTQASGADLIVEHPHERHTTLRHDPPVEHHRNGRTA